MAANDERVDLVGIHHAGGYGSEFDSESDAESKKEKRNDLATKKTNKSAKLPSKKEFNQEYSKEEGRTQRIHLLALDAYSRHRKFINDYLLYYGGSRTEFKRDISRDKRDIDVIREHHQFLWEEDDEVEDSWEKRLAKKYYDKLFKEYCIVDLSRYKENKIAMRWRIDKEVVTGKGQFICGNKKCEEKEGLRSWEVNFAYLEHDIKKNALVKLRLCPECSHKLNYHHRKKEVKKRKSNMAEDLSSKTKRQKQDKGSIEDNSTPQDIEAGLSEAAAPSSSEASTDSDIWSGPAKITEEKSRDEEFDEYFDDMFL